MVDDYRAMFSRFWERFRPGHPDHPVYQKSVEQRSSTIPIAIHGDEGRGLAKVPVLVLAYQVMIPYSGENKLNSSKHSYTTRLLTTLLPSNWYAKKDASINAILQALAHDLTQLLDVGITVCGKQQRFYAAYVACKGDWPWLRKAYALYSGFTSKRICHLCDVSDPLIYSDKF
ncbi:unnamed protein product [Durusdinium trenchii]|uniref:Uncharacterized protein n=1 Tax=Durusdinium trenchii TaxID=1381693 RepID=A0ABP0LW69_9DINO